MDLRPRVGDVNVDLRPRVGDVNVDLYPRVGDVNVDLYPRVVIKKRCCSSSAVNEAKTGRNAQQLHCA